MTGRLIGVVGPSGAGKDTVMAALSARRPHFNVVRRVITRPADSGGENHDAVSAAEFAQRRLDGAFCLDWDAHGLSYGIPADVPERVHSGQYVLVNLSRAMLARAAQIVPRFLVLHLTARPDVLAERLDARGREPANQIQARLDRTVPDWPDGMDVLTVENNGPLDDTVARALAVLNPEGAM